MTLHAPGEVLTGEVSTALWVTVASLERELHLPLNERGGEYLAASSRSILAPNAGSAHGGARAGRRSDVDDVRGRRVDRAVIEGPVWRILLNGEEIELPTSIDGTRTVLPLARREEFDPGGPS